MYVPALRFAPAVKLPAATPLVPQVVLTLPLHAKNV